MWFFFKLIKWWYYFLVLYATNQIISNENLSSLFFSWLGVAANRWQSFRISAFVSFNSLRGTKLKGLVIYSLFLISVFSWTLYSLQSDKPFLSECQNLILVTLEYLIVWASSVGLMTTKSWTIQWPENLSL